MGSGDLPRPHLLVERLMLLQGVPQSSPPGVSPRACIVVVTEVPPWDTTHLPDCPCAIVAAGVGRSGAQDGTAARSAHLGRAVPVFEDYAAATTYLAVEAGGDHVLASIWLDSVAVALGDPAVVIAAPPGLRSHRLLDEVMVLSAPLSGPIGTPAEPLATPLTATERQVLELLVMGHSNAEIAATRGCAIATVARHIRALFRKFSVNSRAELLYACASAAEHRPAARLRPKP